MPQLIAMIIVVVAAMIYMFQTFGGTGDKIEGIAQKTSLITEITNIKNGLKLAAKAQHIAATASGDAVNNLQGLAKLAYFAEQINAQATATGAGTNEYNAISFGGNAGDTTPAMQISLVPSAAISGVKMIPGIYVDLSKGSLKANAAFLESQIATDLESIAYVDRTATSAVAGTTVRGSTTDLEKRTPGDKTTSTTALSTDGKFIVYFKDFGADEVVQ